MWDGLHAAAPGPAAGHRRPVPIQRQQRRIPGMYCPPLPRGSPLPILQILSPLSPLNIRIRIRTQLSNRLPPLVALVVCAPMDLIATFQWEDDLSHCHRDRQGLGKLSAQGK